MLENAPVRIALWGYGDYGKQAAESMKLFWGGAYTVTKIYDIEKRGRDPWWELEISDVANIGEDYRSGAFEKVVVCINNGGARAKVKEKLKTMQIPPVFSGK